jgi:glycosyltransferase involved in cell wall biosynthesis
MALAARFGLDPREVAVVPEAPDPVFGPRRPAEISAALRDLAIDPGAGYFLYAAGISPHKDLRTLLAGYAVLRARRPQAPPLVVVGDVDQTEYVPAGARVRSMIAELGIGDRVLLPGFVSDEVLACLYGAATAVVNPSPAEGFGLPAVEAAACGAACVLSDIPAHRETLGGAALFVPPRAPEALGAALEQMLEDEAGRRELGARARAAVAPLSWEAAARVLRDEITAVVEG